MFTGIVESPGEIAAVIGIDGGRHLRIRTDLVFDNLHHDQSVAVSGVCLTVEALGDDWFEAFPTAEIIEKTCLGNAVESDRVNLERVPVADDHFDGHTVQGHIDGTTTATNAERVGDDWFSGFDLPKSLTDYVVQKGSVCLSGVGLTVAGRREGTFAVAIAPMAYDLTTPSERTVDDPIHIEVDTVVKYVESMLDGYTERLVVE